MTNIYWSRRGYTEQEFKQAVASSCGWADVIRALGRTPSGGNYESTKSLAKILEVDTTHFTRSTGKRTKPTGKSIPLQEVLVDNRSTSSDGLRKRLIAEGVLAEKCSAPFCTLPEVMIDPFTGKETKYKLELDHINGKKADNRLENLRLLCPTCHSYTDTYRGKNINGGVRVAICTKKYKVRRVKKEKTLVFCGCGSVLSRRAKICLSCYNAKKVKKIDWPSTQELLDRVKATSYTQVGKELGVSDNAVRKRIRNYPIV